MHLGEFGIVYRGALIGWEERGQDVIAVKTLKGTNRQPQHILI